MVAASATPSCDPIPPSTTIARTNAHSVKRKRLWADEALPGGEKGPGKPAEHCAHRKGGEFGRRGVDAERAAGDLVFAQRLPGAADRQTAQPQRDPVGDERERENEVVQEHDAVGRRIVQTERRGKAVFA